MMRRNIINLFVLISLSLIMARFYNNAVVNNLTNVKLFLNNKIG